MGRVTNGRVILPVFVWRPKYEERKGTHHQTYKIESSPVLILHERQHTMFACLKRDALIAS
jgi:hypothetical protein